MFFDHIYLELTGEYTVSWLTSVVYWKRINFCLLVRELQGNFSDLQLTYMLEKLGSDCNLIYPKSQSYSCGGIGAALRYPGGLEASTLSVLFYSELK